MLTNTMKTEKPQSMNPVCNIISEMPIDDLKKSETNTKAQSTKSTTATQ